MYVIGLTGGVGSGKTRAAVFLAEELKAELLIADELGHVAMEPGTEGYRQIVASFGDSVLKPGGEIHRGRLSERVFGNEAELRKLNQIIHPAVFRYLQEYIRGREGKDGYLVLETAIMFETGCDRLCDEIWLVAVSPEKRRERLMRDRGYSEGKSDAIMLRQLSLREYRERCSLVIENNGTLKEFEDSLRGVCGRLQEKGVCRL